MFAWLRRRFAGLGYMDPVYIARFEKDLDEVGKKLPHGWGSVRACLDREERCIQMRPYYGASSVVIAEIKTRGSEGAPTDVVVKSTEPFSDELKALFIEHLPVPVCFEVHT